MDIEAIQSAVAKAGNDGLLTPASVENINRWLTEPQFAEFASQIAQRVEDGQFEALDNDFWQVVPFGTGGRRGRMGELGPATINVRTIAESAHGLAVYSQKARNSSDGRAVIAYDSRNRSAEFAKLTATTLAANGYQVFLFSSCRSTPELSFAVRHLKCDVGAMISASHNPPADNGFKAYWSSGAQVLAPHDKGIIDCVYQASDIPTIPFDEAVADGKIEVVGEEVDRAFIDAVLAMSLSDKRDLNAIFTPLHGVGETSAYRTLQEAGFAGVSILESQRDPDGNFPNVPDQLPNPERSEVFDPAIKQAKKSGAGLILACDPDADRLGIVVRGSDGKFTHLTGNQIAALLVDFVLRKRTANASLSPEHFIVETLVTTPLFAAIGRAHNVRVIDDLLVGFKYIAQTMDAEGPDKFVFGAEESLGYLAGEYCRDKDASVAALFAAELGAELADDGKTLLDRLDELYVEHGYFIEGQRSEVCEGPTGQKQIEQLMADFRTAPPTELAGITLQTVRDFSQHEIRSLPANKKSGDLPNPSGNLLFFDSAEGPVELRIAVRPSGTEPKIKFYFFARAQCSSAEKLEETKAQANEAMTACQDALSTWVRSRLA